VFIIINTKEEPANKLYDLLCPSNSILRVIANNAESKALL
jgi:hypothetical protein